MIPRTTTTDPTPPPTDHDPETARYAAIDREHARLGQIELQIHHTRHGQESRCGFCQE